MTSVMVDFSKACTDSFDLFKKNIGLLIGAFLLVIVVGSACGFLVPAVMVGYYAIALRLIDGDPKCPTAGDIFSGFSFFLPALVVGVVCSLVGFMLCGIGYLVTMPLTTLAFLHMYDTQNTTIFGSLVEVCKRIINGGWMLLLWLFVASIIGGAGSAFCFVGVLATFPLGMLIMAHVYRQAFPKA